jgi:DNA modification methylase
METNVIYCGDNTEVMRGYIPSGSVDLIYADPPFFSNRNYEVIWGDGYELRSFEDRWKGGIHNYIAWMKPRIQECHRVLKRTGSMYLHCDWHANAHLRLLMDKVFGENNFLNEIVWCYEIGGKSKSYFGRKHDIIFFYAKKFGKHTFNVEDVKMPRKKGSHMKVGIDKNGRKYQEKRDRKTGKVYRYYLDEGKIPDDFWIDIMQLNREDKERLGYPTQKPERLIERMVKASSNPMDIVLDPFCGCGTATSVAHKLGRRWVGIDVSPTACKLMAKRMRKLGIKGVKVIGLPRTVKELKALQPFEFQNWVFEKLHGRVNPRKIGDYGIDGWVELDVPTQVKQSDDVGRNVVDNFETAIRRYGKKKGVIVAFSFTRGAYEEVARVRLLDEMRRLEIKLKTVEEILKET